MPVEAAENGEELADYAAICSKRAFKNQARQPFKQGQKRDCPL